MGKVEGDKEKSEIDSVIFKCYGASSISLCTEDCYNDFDSKIPDNLRYNID